MTTMLEKAAAMAAKTKTVKPTPEEVMPDLTGPAVQEIPMAIHTPEATVAVYGHHLMCKRDIELASAVLLTDYWQDAKHGVRMLRFLGDGAPVGKDGLPIFANCAPELGGIAINLAHTFDKARELVENEPERSIWGVYNQMLVQSYAHEAYHVSQRVNAVGDELAALPEDKEEKDAEETSFSMLCYIAKTIDISPAHYTLSPFFLHEWKKVLQSDGEEEWVKKQKHLLENNIFFRLEPDDKVPDGFEINSFKAYIQLLSEDQDSEEWDQVVGGPSLAEMVRDIQGNYIPPAGGATVGVVNTGTAGVTAGDVAEYMEYEEPMTDHGQPHVAMADNFAGNNPNVFLNNMNGGNAGAAGASGFAQANQVTPERAVYPQHSFTKDQVSQIVIGVYYKIYQHIFSNCGPQVNSDVGFLRPEAVAEMPIQLTEQEKQVVVKYDSQSEMGQPALGMRTADGLLRGSVTSKAKIPAYKLYINGVGGIEECRFVIPQNTAKMDAQGQYTKGALEARGGNAIMLIMEGNDQKAASTGKKFLGKIKNGNLELA